MIKSPPPFVTHLLVDLYDCEVDLNDADFVSGCMSSLVQQFGLTPIGQHQIAYPEHGLTIVIFLKESHFLLSTWPELGTVQVDLAYCGDVKSVENFTKKLMQDLKAKSIKQNSIIRTLT